MMRRTDVTTHAGPLKSGYAAQLLVDEHNDSYWIQIVGRTEAGAPHFVRPPMGPFQSTHRAIEVAHEWAPSSAPAPK